jgi:hypothetical protein
MFESKQTEELKDEIVDKIRIIFNHLTIPELSFYDLKDKLYYKDFEINLYLADEIIYDIDNGDVFYNDGYDFSTRKEYYELDLDLLRKILELFESSIRDNYITLNIKDIKNENEYYYLKTLTELPSYKRYLRYQKSKKFNL